MELWIRSQNKKALIRADYIEYGEWNKEHRIYINGEECGKYKSKERALEVLDEIQKRLKSNVSYKENSLYLSNGYNYFAIPYEESSQVYEMPEE